MVDELLDRIGFTSSEFLHPVELLTVERVASRVGVPVTSLDSAIRSADALRDEVLAEAVRSLDTTPGSRTWSALRESIVRVRRNNGAESRSKGWIVSPLLAARGQELADDPAFPLLLSAFDRFDNEALALIARQVLRGVFEEFWPFISTACADSPIRCPAQAPPRVETMATLILCADGYRRLLGASAADGQGEHVLTDVLGSALAAEVGSDVVDLSIVPLTAPNFLSVEQEPITQLVKPAVRAGADILLERDLHFTTTITVAEARRRTGLSNTAFYKTFGSLAELEELILQRANREIAAGYADEFFREVLDDLRAGDIAHGLERLAAHNAEHQRRHVFEGRPGRELTPWLGYPDVGPVVSAAYRSAFDERGDFYNEFAQTVGASLAPGLDGRSVAGVLHAVSVISDYFIRVSPDRDGALAWAAKRLPELNVHFAG